MHSETKIKTQFKGVAMLFLTSFIWGVAFVAQSVGMESVGAFTFSGIRTLMSCIVLLPVILIKDKLSGKKMTEEDLAKRKEDDKNVIKKGILLGIVFFAATNFQQYAFNYTAAGKIAFITALYMFFVPLFGLLLKKRIPLLTWICVGFGFVGLYFLCVNPEEMGNVNFGDILTIICAVLFAVHILMVEKFAYNADGLKLSWVQFFVAGIISSIIMLIFEEPSWAAIKTAAIPLLYAGCLSCGIAYTFQIIGQKYTEATIASLIMSTESLFGVLASAIFLHEVLSGREIVGCVIMFVAIVLSQLSEVITEKLNKFKSK